MPDPGLRDHPEDRPYSSGEGKPRASGAAVKKGIAPPRTLGTLLGLSPVVGTKGSPKSSPHPPCRMHWESLRLEAWASGLL